MERKDKIEKKKLAMKTVSIKSLSEVKGGSLTAGWSYQTIHCKPTDVE